jgi:hypothetical protein
LVNNEEEAKIVLCSSIIKRIQCSDYFDALFCDDLEDLMLQGNQFFNDLMCTQYIQNLLKTIINSSSAGESCGKQITL